MFSLKGKINAPPKDPDEQPVPRSLIQLFAFENKEKKKKKKINKKSSFKGKIIFKQLIKRILKIINMYVYSLIIMLQMV